MDLILNGSQRFRVNPVGKRTLVKLTSGWADPKFDGAFLPDDHEISSEGFTAIWDVSYVNRAYPQRWIDYQSGFHASTFGVDLILPVNPAFKSVPLGQIRFAYYYFNVCNILFNRMVYQTIIACFGISDGWGSISTLLFIAPFFFRTPGF